MKSRIPTMALCLTMLGCSVASEETSQQRLAERESVQPCEDAISTREMTSCYGAIVQRSEQRHDRYLAHAVERQNGTPSLTKAIRTSDAAFRNYRAAECDGVLESYDRGTVRGLMRQLCLIQITDRRTLTIWENWHQYADSTPPDLPKPEPHLP